MCAPVCGDAISSSLEYSPPFEKGRLGGILYKNIYKNHLKNPPQSPFSKGEVFGGGGVIITKPVA
jgi:hypothetical protein